MKASCENCENYTFQTEGRCKEFNAKIVDALGWCPRWRTKETTLLKKIILETDHKEQMDRYKGVLF